MRRIYFALICLLCSLSIFVYCQYASQQDQYMDIQQLLNVEEVQLRASRSVLANDQLGLAQLQSDIINIAEQLDLSPQDMRFIRSDKLTDYFKFRVQRAEFTRLVEQRYRTLAGIDDLKQKFPSADPLFARADALIARRDQLIQEIAQSLAAEVDQDVDAAWLAAAQQAWLQRLATN